MKTYVIMIAQKFPAGHPRAGQPTFHPAKSDKWNDTCRHCLLWVPCEEWSQDDECLRAPCYADDRADHQRGYFSIQDFPKRKEAAV